MNAHLDLLLDYKMDTPFLKQFFSVLEFYKNNEMVSILVNYLKINKEVHGILNVILFINGIKCLSGVT